MTSPPQHSAIEEVELAGVRLCIDPRIVSPAIVQAIRAGRYERPEAKVIPGVIGPGERVVDLGGGLGFTAALAARTGHAELVACVEAHPGLIPLIERTRELNGLDLVVRNAAVAPTREPPTMPFHLHEEFWASSLSPIAQDRLRGVVEVPVVTFDDLVRDYDPTLLVVDIEVLKTFMQGSGPTSPSGARDQLDAIELGGVAKVLLQVHRSVAGVRGVKRVFDWMSSRSLVYSPDHSRGSVVLFENIQA